MATSTWFTGCGTTDLVKRRYRELAKRHHPDVAGGSTATMVAINVAYAQALKAASARSPSRPGSSSRCATPPSSSGAATYHRPTQTPPPTPRYPTIRPQGAPVFSFATYAHFIRAAAPCPYCRSTLFQRTNDGRFEVCSMYAFDLKADGTISHKGEHEFIRRVPPDEIRTWLAERRATEEREKQRREEQERAKREHEIWLKTREGVARTHFERANTCSRCKHFYEDWIVSSLDPHYEFCPKCRNPRLRPASATHTARTRVRKAAKAAKTAKADTIDARKKAV
jgi:hypothetical protein